jgi:hypothetical protein
MIVAVIAYIILGIIMSVKLESEILEFPLSFISQDTYRKAIVLPILFWPFLVGASWIYFVRNGEGN